MVVNWSQSEELVTSVGSIAGERTRLAATAVTARRHAERRRFQRTIEAASPSAPARSRPSPRRSPPARPRWVLLPRYTTRATHKYSLESMNCLLRRNRAISAQNLPLVATHRHSSSWPAPCSTSGASTLNQRVFGHLAAERRGFFCPPVAQENLGELRTWRFKA
jgi:hypothetical protein